MVREQVLVTFIIPHKGREEMLKQTLASIALQQFDLKKVEVLVLTQNEFLASDTLPDSGELQVRVLPQPTNATISALRNAGVAESNSDYLAFLDADVEIASNWIEQMLSELNAQPGRVLVSAVQRCADDAPVLEKIRTVLSNAAIDTAVRFLPGRNLFIRRETFQKAGGFPEHLVTCEDYYFTDRVYEQGELYYSSRSSYVHLGEDKEFDEMFKKEVWRGQSNLQSIKGRRIPLSELPSFLVPLWILFFACGAFFSLMLLNFQGAILTLGFALLPVLIYSWRLKRIAGDRVAFWDIMHFYVMYFPARIKGTLTGLFKVIQIQ